MILPGLVTAVYRLAADTGWSELTIRRMPLPKCLLYLHAACIANGAETRWKASGATREEVRQRLNQYFER